MKTLLLAAALAAVTLLSACQQEPQSANDRVPLPLASRTSSANPKVVYVNGDGHLAVMDSDGSHQTVINTSEFNRNGNLCPTWSPGNSITYVTSVLSNDTVYSAIRALNVSVNSNGIPVASNLRSLTSYKYVQSDSVTRMGGSCWSPAWSSTSSVDKIAFVAIARDGSGKYICRVSASGGSVDTLWRTSDQIRSNPAWNADDSRIAISCSNSGRGYIIILNTSNGAVTDSINLGNHTPSYMEWSRAAGSINKLVLIDGGDYHLYYLTPSSGSSIESTGIATFGATWSPTNSTVMYNYTKTSGGSRSYSYPLVKVRPSSTTTTTLVSDLGFDILQLNWHR